jgi:hypothetical protein
MDPSSARLIKNLLTSSLDQSPSSSVSNIKIQTFSVNGVLSSSMLNQSFNSKSSFPGPSPVAFDLVRLFITEFNFPPSVLNSSLSHTG